MNPSIPIPFPIPSPNGRGRCGNAVELNHRDTETQSHRTVASAKTQRRKGITKPSQSPLSAKAMAGWAFKNEAPTLKMTSVFLCAPLCLCVEKSTAAPEIGAVQ
jgi:hypothetical protein